MVSYKMTDEEYTAWLEYMSTECYACATQRHACEHDNWEEYHNGRSWEDDSIPFDWEIEGETHEK